MLLLTGSYLRGQIGNGFLVLHVLYKEANRNISRSTPEYIAAYKLQHLSLVSVIFSVESSISILEVYM